MKTQSRRNSALDNGTTRPSSAINWRSAPKLTGLREGAEIAIGGKTVGIVTSGGFAPTLGRAIAMGYVERAQSANGTKVELLVRGKPVPMVVSAMPFVPTNYYRG